MCVLLRVKGDVPAVILCKLAGAEVWAAVAGEQTFYVLCVREIGREGRGN